MSVTTGPYVMGERPGPLTYQFQDASGAALNLTGYSDATFQHQEQDGAASVAVATVSDAVNGKVTYTFTGDEFATAGHYRAQFWVGNGAQLHASVDIKFDVAVPVGPVPNI